MVYEFRIKYQRKEDAQYLINSLQQKYEVTQDWTGSIYSGIALNWDDKARILEISMSGYVKEALHKFQLPPPVQLKHSPHQ